MAVTVRSLNSNDKNDNINVDVKTKSLIDYNSLLNIPTINNTELKKGTSLSELNIASKDDVESLDNAKQDVLTAGNNISINNNVISVTGDLGTKIILRKFK